MPARKELRPLLAHGGPLRVKTDSVPRHHLIACRSSKHGVAESGPGGDGGLIRGGTSLGRDQRRAAGSVRSRVGRGVRT